MSSTFSLEDGPLAERECAPGAAHDYTISVRDGEYLVIAVEQRGVDVRLELSPPGKPTVVAIDSPGGPEGLERVSLVAEGNGEWRLDVLADPGVQDSGAHYAIAIQTRRAATARDRRMVAGEYALAAGEEIRRDPNRDLTQAEALYVDALTIAQEIGDRALEANAQHRIGWVRNLQGKDATAIEPLQAACDIASEIGERQLEAVASGDLGDVSLAEWMPSNAEQAYRRSLARWQELDRAEGIADAWHGLGRALDEQGRAEEARHAYEQALALSARMSAPIRAAQEATFRFSLGQLLMGRAEYAAARDLLGAALVTWEKSEEVARQSNALSKLGEIAALEGQIGSAREKFETALGLAISAGHESGIALAENGLGEALIRAGELATARSRLESARSRFNALGDRYAEAIATMNLGRAWYVSGEDAKATEFHRAALALFELLGDRQGIASNRYGLARSSFRQRDLGSARADLDIALAEVEGLRGEALRIASRSSYFASRQDYFDLDLALILAERESEPKDTWNTKAFAAGERRRARSLLDLLSEAGGRIRRDANPAALAEERQVQDQLDGVENHRRNLVFRGSSAASLAQVEAEERALIARLEGIRADFRRSNPRRADLAAPKPVDLERARTLLDERTALLAYSLGVDQSVLWVLQRDAAPDVYLLPSRATIEELARRVASLFARVDSGAEAPRQSAAKALARAILPSALAELPAGRLAIVSEGGLQGVPFAALPDLGQPAEANGEPPPLLARFELVQLPSVSALSTLRDETGRRHPILGGIAVVADPVFSSDDPRVDRGGGLARPQGLNPLPNTYRRLSATGREAEEILSEFPPTQRFIARDFSADRKLVREGKLRGFRFVHFATHAEVDSERPELSGLVFSTVNAQGLPLDGHLRLHEIYDLDLPSELVVLSACSTGVGRDVRGEGLESLARGFLSAGAPRLVVSLWPVEDEGTALLMGRFYREMVRERQGPANALRRAQLSLRLDPRFRDPYHWAGFVFLGDWEFPGVRKEDEIATKDDLPIEQLHTGGTGERPRPANPMPGPRPKPRPPLPESPPPAADQKGKMGAQVTPVRLAFNGLRARSGRALLPPLSASEFGKLALGLPVDEETLALLKDYLAGNAARDAQRAPRWDVKDPGNLAETGWGVLFAPGVSKDVEDALAPLLDRRRSQMEAKRFIEFHGVAADSAHELLSMPAINHQQGTSPDAERLPYYLLLVGDPSRLSYRLQTQLDVRYAVGRLHLANADEYGAYAAAVVAAEKGEKPRDLDLAFFAARGKRDMATVRTLKELVKPLASTLRRQRSDWKVRTIRGREATRARLGHLLESERPSVLFTTSHGVGYDMGDPDQIERQGALICADWPGEGKDLYDDYCFAGSDVPPGADLAGAIAFLFACYGAGTPEHDSFAVRSPVERGSSENEPKVQTKKLATSPFISRLPQRLLAAGALAVIGHVDRAWTTSFTWNQVGGHVRTYNDILRLLMEGYSVGWAMEQMNLQAADLSSAMADVWKDQDFFRSQDMEMFTDLWLSSSDARNYVVLGDPAVRLNLSVLSENGSPSSPQIRLT